VKIKRAILGGSFDPIHLGHLHLINCLFEQTDYNTLYIVPVNINNFKRSGSHLSSRDRLAMLYLAKEDFYELYPQNKAKKIIIDDREIVRSGISYTIDTVRAIKQEENIKEKIGLVMGDDLIADLKGWYKYTELKDEVNFVVFNRLNKKKEKKEGLTYIDNEIIEVSSTEVRAGNFSVLSKRVAQYVREKALYN